MGKEYSGATSQFEDRASIRAKQEKMLTFQELKAIVVDMERITLDKGNNPWALEAKR